MFCISSIIVMPVTLALLIFNIDVSESRLLMIPKMHSTNVIDYQANNIGADKCKV